MPALPTLVAADGMIALDACHGGDPADAVRYYGAVSLNGCREE